MVSKVSFTLFSPFLCLYTSLPLSSPPSVTVSSPEIPDADVLLHADCNDQEVICEISRYFPQGSQDGTEPAYFIGSLQLEGGGLSITMVLKTLDVESDKSEETLLIQNKLRLPLSQSGSLLTEGEIRSLISCL